MPKVDIRRAAKKALVHHIHAKQMGLNEADTVRNILRWFEEVFGYDPRTELTCELAGNSHFLDIAVKFEDKIQLIVEVKRAGTELTLKHLEQAQTYANSYKLWWALLTNGTHWILYHFERSQKNGLQAIPVIDVDLSEPENLEEKIDLLAVLHRRTLSAEALKAVYNQVRVTGPKVVARGLFTEVVLKTLSREIHREEGVRFDVNELRHLLEGMFSDDVQSEIGSMRVKKKKQKQESFRELPAQQSPSTVVAGAISVPVDSAVPANLPLEISPESEAEAKKDRL